MFKKSDMDSYQSSGENGAATIIAEGVKVEGNFVSRGNILIDGEVKGSIKTDQDLRIGEKAKVTANVVATNVLISGELQGNLKVNGTLELSPTAKIYGDIEAKVFVVAAGAMITGKCLMGAEVARVVETSVRDSVRERKSAILKADEA